MRRIVARLLICCGLIGATLFAWLHSSVGHRFWLHHLSLAELLRYALHHNRDTEAYIELASRMEAQGHYEEALQDYLHAARQCPSQKAWLGAIRCAQQTLAPAQTLLLGQEMVRALPSSSQAWAAIGKLYLDIGDRLKAAQMFQKAVACNPQDSEAQYGLSTALYQSEDLQDALVAAQKAVSLSPNHLPYLLNLATILQQLGQPARAIAILKQAERISPRNPIVLASIGKLLATTAISRSEQQYAAQLLQESVDKLTDPLQAAQAYYQLGQLNLQIGKLSEAEHSFYHVLQNFPNDTQTLFALGRTLALEGKIAESKQVLARFYTESQFRITLSQLQMRIARQPNHAELWARLAQLYAKHGDWANAIQAAQHSLQLNPHQFTLQKRIANWNRGLTQQTSLKH